MNDPPKLIYFADVTELVLHTGRVILLLVGFVESMRIFLDSLNDVG